MNEARRYGKPRASSPTGNRARGYGRPERVPSAVAGFPYDFTTKAGILASLVVPTRTGVAIYPQITPNTDPAGATVEQVGDNLPIWENRGPGLAGLAVFDAYANSVPDVADFSVATGGWTASAAIVYMSNVGTSPLGVSDADRLGDNSTTAARSIFRTSVSSRTTKKLWVKDVPSDPATARGELCHSTAGGDGGAGGRTVFPTAAQWQLIRHIVRISNSAFAIFPAGDSTAGAGRAALGSMDVWGAQMALNSWFDLPLAAGGGSTTGMCVCPVVAADLTSIVGGDGEVDLEVTFAPLSNDEGYSAAAEYLWRFTTPQGELSLRLSGTTFNLLTLRVGGSDVATTSVTGVDNTCGWSWDQELAVRVRITPTSARIRSRVNCGGVVDRIVTGLSLTLGTPTAGWVGSNGTTAGSSFNALIKRVEVFTSHTAMATATGPAASIVVLGDSIQSFRGSANEPAPAVLMGSIAEAAAGKRVVTIATPSDSIEGQEAKFAASQYASSSTAAALICVAINNILAGDTVATLCTKYQSLINTIRAASATAKIIVYQVLPADANTSMTATMQQRWVDFNSCLAGVPAGGGVAVTGYDRFNVTASNALNTNGAIGAAGVNVLVAPNAAGIHPLLDGRQLIANNYVSDLQSFGLW